MCVNPRHKKDSFQARNVFWYNTQLMKIVDKEKIRPVKQPHQHKYHQGWRDGISHMRLEGRLTLHDPALSKDMPRIKY
jgi:hypothetical protein